VSLQTKLFVWLCGPLTLLWFSGMVAAYLLTQRMVGLAFDQNLLATALTVSTQIEGSDRDGKPHLRLSPNDERMLLFDPVDEVRYAVLDEEGATVAGQHDIPLPVGIVTPGKPAFYDAPLGKQSMRWAALVAAQKDEDDPKPIRATIVVGETLRKREALSQQTLYLTTLPQIGLVALLGALVWFGLQRGLRPLHELRQRVQERSETDLHPIAIDGRASEIDALRDALNGLMVRLDRTLALQNEFIGNAAHQLRKVDFDAKEQKGADYLRLNPNGMVPTLVVDGARLHAGDVLTAPAGSVHRESWSAEGCELVLECSPDDELLRS